MPSLADLIRMGKQYIGDAMPGGSLNPETAPVARQANYLSGILDPASQVSQDATNWHKRTQIGLKDQLAGRQTPEAEQAYQTMMMAAGMAPIGMTAWHGSPHKFDKFSLDKIGTGEGAQAYGHGLYLAESPEVGKEYARVLTKNAFFDGKPIYEIDPNTIGRRDTILSGVSNVGSDARGAIPGRYTPQGMDSSYDGPIAAMKALIESGKVPKNATKWLDESGNIKVSSVEPQLYKTDIPDEAVARFLDWDKPLSQQAPEVQIALKNMQNKQTQNVLDSRVETFNKLRASGQDTKRVERSIEILKEEIANPELQGTSGEGFYKYLRNRLGEQNLATDQLRQYGIPGIRYLDGGSRSTGQGSSNFVAFDPEMIRILERNGQPTGLEPWKPGEYRLKDLIGKE